MKKVLLFFFVMVLLNSICFAKSENVTALLNKKINIMYGFDLNEHSRRYFDEDNKLNELSEYSPSRFTFYTKSGNERSEYSHYDIETYPISYDGTTYLPVRAISGLFNQGITWNENDKSVRIGEGEKDWKTYDVNDELSKSKEMINITALRNEDVKVYYNGQIQSFTDVNGKAVYPLTYNDTTYLPVRAVANMFDMLIDWEEKTNSVIIRKKSSSRLFEDNKLTCSLSYLTDSELEIALNELFAVHGHDFDTQRLEDYFIQKSWYKKIDGKKVAAAELTKDEQDLLTKIQNEIALRKTYKDVNTLTQPNVTNISNYVAAKVYTDQNNEKYVKIYDDFEKTTNVKDNISNISKVLLIPSKVYTMDTTKKYYFKYNDEVYIVPTVKVYSANEEKITLLEPGIEIYKGGNLVINGKIYENFFEVFDFEYIDGEHPDNLFDYLLSYTPESGSFVGYKYNFDNDVNTNEYLFDIFGTGFEAGSTYFEGKEKYIYLDKDGKEISIFQSDEILYNYDLDYYSNLFVRKPGWFDDLGEGYQPTFYGLTMLSEYVKERFVDAYYIFIPNQGFVLVNRTLDGNKIDMSKYLFTIQSDINLYALERYPNEMEYSNYLTEGIDVSKYDKIWYSFNEQWEDEDRNENAPSITIKEGTKVKVAYAEGWWHIVFENEAGNEAYIIHFTPAGVT